MGKPTIARRQAAFRMRIAPACAGWALVALILAVGAVAIWYCGRQITHPDWYEFAVILIAFCLPDAFERWIAASCAGRSWG
jgi:hypothetical protein